MRLFAAVVVFILSASGTDAFSTQLRVSPHHATPIKARAPQLMSINRQVDEFLLQQQEQRAAAAASRDFGPRRLIGYLWPSDNRVGEKRAKLRVLGALVLLFLAKLFVVRVPFIFKRCIDSLSAPASSGGTILAVGVWMLIYGFSRAVYTLLQEGRYLLFTPVGQNALRRFMSDAFEHVQSLDAAWLGAQSTGELSRVFARGVRGMNALLRLFVFNIVPTALETLLVCQLLGRRYGIPFLITSLLSVTGFVAWSLFVVEKRIAVVAALNDNDNKLFTQFFNSLLNNEAVRSFTNERHEVGRYDELLGGAESLAVRDVKTISLLNAGQALLFSAGLGTVMALCARRVLAGQLTVGDVVAIHGILLQLQQPLNSLAFTYQEIRTSLTDMRQLNQLLRRSPKVYSPPNAQPLHVSEGVLKFENVSFGYENSTTKLLQDVSFEVPARKKTAIVGSSGSGKSTVLKLILRSYDPDQGRVTIDGQDVKSVDLTSLRNQLGLVPQDTILFDESVMYNLRYGDLDASDEKVIEKASAVGLDSTLARMPDGLRSRVGERGLTLSGGERQRVAIARALLKDPPLMLYDEPTSSLDGITEEAVEKVLHQSERNRTSVVVAHKLKLVQDADLILVMENGTLVEQGTHASLLCQVNSTYSRMWAQQRYGDTDFFDERGPPLWCEYIDPLEAEERLEVQTDLASLGDSLASESSGSGWLW